MEIPVIHFIVLGVITGLTKGAGVLPDGPLNAVLGGRVMFTATLTPSEKPFTTIGWTFGSRNIITFSGVNITAPEYEGRITLSMATGSLELRNLTLNDRGEYRVLIQPQGDFAKEGSTRLEVYERLTGVAITPSTNLLIERNSVSLTCNADAGSGFTRLWTKDDSDWIPTDNITLYDNNRVLSFKSLNKKDSGEYSCKIRNPVRNDEATYIMVVNYGPENVQITGPSEIHFEQTLKLTCSAESEPSASYTWTLNGTEIHNSSVFTKVITEFSDSGNYTCQAMNHITERGSSVVHQVIVTAIPEKLSCSSAGCIAGAVIACFIICVAAAGGGYYIYKEKIHNKAQPQPGRKGVEEPVYSIPLEEESQYENMKEIQLQYENMKGKEPPQTGEDPVYLVPYQYQYENTEGEEPVYLTL
ncbi:carcinoembryonic antigen-related cell adhesion molecule 1-like isoform X2 [Acanthopagrus latus]|uniref:carcinoembryonic antigen-related cell adhesion molecule 1-like isoform X2 n=1 Tax=Acanthopagrus latus TaxID=8177 RepID=UPI00187C0D1E|nr:carcinoembryonic antigen-related cell adhesion molecule 1-like isoform X2 [Acanthopagrus latus]XP_036931288.1 carcinoembryonic antigen-related cell adhesion molecule 1-like isoform X2 [Acanthopagrus latus]